MVCFSNSNCKILPLPLTLPYVLAAPGKESVKHGLQVLKGTHTRGTAQLFSEFSEAGNTYSWGGLQGKLFEDLCSVMISVVIISLLLFSFF